MKNKRVSALRAGLAVSAAGSLGFGLLATVGAGTAFAAPVSASLDYSCNYPLIGTRDLKVNLQATIPAQVQAGTGTPDIRVDTTDTISSDTVEGLHAIGATTLEGVAYASANIASPNNPDAAGPVSMQQTLEKINIPASGTAAIRSFGVRGGIQFNNNDTVTVSLGDLTLRVTPKKADGTATGLGSFTVKCTQVGQSSTTLATMQVVSNPVNNQPTDDTPPDWYKNQAAPDITEKASSLHYNLNLNGSTFVKAPNGNAKIVGNIAVDVDGTSGDITGPLTLQPTTGNFNILGFLPVTTQIAFVQKGNTIGKYTGGVINTTSTMSVKYASFNAFGAIPIGGGADCGTTTTMDVAMHSAPAPSGSNPFNPYKGGSFNADGYTLPGIANCGALNDIISLFEAGPGNTITATLSPAS